jgi:TolB-like protein
MSIITFGTFELNVLHSELRKRGLRIALADQPLRVLTALLERPGDVIRRDNLYQRLWPEGTFVDFEHSLNAAVRRLRVTLGDNADVPKFIETVHRRGYRFIVSGARTERARAHNSGGRARLAVVPFDPCDGFSRGLTEEVMTQLTQVCAGTVAVIARASVDRAQRDGGDTAGLARTLRADYVVAGHVRRDGDRVRITAQLVESEQETHLWAKAFDRVLIDELSLQAEVAGEIATAVTVSVVSNGRRAAS